MTDLYRRHRRLKKKLGSSWEKLRKTLFLQPKNRYKISEKLKGLAEKFNGK